ncbi:MAG: hypothetical protein M5U28_38215 [Sandaracinaceae bacterium]|nr:hypothetical protein [Sandaracinaceae bacterium]
MDATTRAAIDILHVEPSWLCNLDCPLCIPKAERKSIKDPPWNVEPTLWVALVHNLKIHGVERVRVLDPRGRGDPMMHPHLAHLCKVFHLVFPETLIQVTTNGNFPFPPELMESGLTHLRVSADGARDESYRTYRRDGELSKVLAFLRGAVESRARSGRDVLIEWKYILFEWNDTDEEMLEAYSIAADLGVKLSSLPHPLGRQVAALRRREPRAQARGAHATGAEPPHAPRAARPRSRDGRGNVSPRASVLVIEYGTASHLGACLRALEATELPPEALEIVVVDNASPTPPTPCATITRACAGSRAAGTSASPEGACSARRARARRSSPP